MYNGVLNKLIKSGKPILYKNLKLTVAQANFLIDLDLVTPVIIQTTKSVRKTPNALQINAKGIAFLALSQNKELQIYKGINDLQKQFENIYILFKETQTNVVDQFESLKDPIIELNAGLKVLLNEVNKVSEPSKEGINQAHVMQSIETYKGKLSNIASVHRVIEDLQGKTGLPKGKIEKYIYSIYLEGGIELIPGQGPEYALLRGDDGILYKSIKV